MQRWYYLLVPNTENKKESLFEKNPSIQETNLVICWQLEYRKYSVFQDLLEFSNFFQSIKKNKELCFYEVIQDKAQKIYFDIDSTPDILPLQDCPRVMNIITTEIASLLSEYSDKFLIQVFESHSLEKISFHIVVDKICVVNVKHNRVFFEKLMKRLEDITVNGLPHLYLPSLFDKSMYKRIQQYRTVLSTKFNQQRFKIPCYDLYMNQDFALGYEPIGKNQKSLILNMFRSGFVSVLAGCDYIFMPEAEKVSNKISSYLDQGSIELNPEFITRALNLYMELNSNDKTLPFRVIGEYPDDNKHCIVSLERLRPSWCNLCKRTHSSENPYLLFWSDEIHVSFDCRRHENGERLYLGCLNPLKIEKIELISEEKEHPMQNRLMGLFKNF